MFLRLFLLCLYCYYFRQNDIRTNYSYSTYALLRYRVSQRKNDNLPDLFFLTDFLSLTDFTDLRFACLPDLFYLPQITQIFTNIFSSNLFFSSTNLTDSRNFYASRFIQSWNRRWWNRRCKCHYEWGISDYWRFAYCRHWCIFELDTRVGYNEFRQSGDEGRVGQLLF